MLADVDTELCLPPGILMGELFMTASVFISALPSLMPLSKLALPLLSNSVKVLLDEGTLLSKLRDNSNSEQSPKFGFLGGFHL